MAEETQEEGIEYEVCPVCGNACPRDVITEKMELMLRQIEGERNCSESQENRKRRLKNVKEEVYRKL
jgi:flavoprotein